jgi:O-antigen/teichoic acid export membrane protein
MANRLIAAKGVLARNVLANWTVLVAEVLVAFFLTPFIVQALGLPTYGVWSLLNSLVGYMGLIDLGIRGSVGRFVNVYLARGEHDRVREVISTSLAFLTGGALVALVVAVIIGSHFGELFPRTPPELIDEIRAALPILTVGLLIAFWGAVYRSLLVAFDRFDLANAVGLLGLAIRVAFTVLVLRMGGGLVGLVWVMVGTLLVMNVLNVVLAARCFPGSGFARRWVSRERFREMWKFGTVAFTSRTASTMAVQSGPVIAMAFLGPAAVGIYSIALQLVQICQRVLEQLGVVIYPSVMKLGGVEDRDGLKSVFLWFSRLQYLVAGLLYFGVIGFAAAFIRLWVGAEFDEAGPVTRILAVGELLMLAGSTASLTLFSLGRLKINLQVSIAEAIAMVVLAVVLAGPLGMGLPGMALGTIIPRIVSGAVAYPLAAARVIGLGYATYILKTALRVGAVALVIVPAFLYLESLLGARTWPGFFAAVAAATALYAVIAAPILLGWEGRTKVLELLRARRNA